MEEMWVRKGVRQGAGVRGVDVDGGIFVVVLVAMLRKMRWVGL
jgi:hypothetical protein